MLTRRTVGSALIAVGILAAFIAVASAEEPCKDVRPAAKLPAEATCPVTGEKFKPDANTATAVHKGTTYYFCCPGCKPQFLADPEKFVKAQKQDDKKDEKKSETKENKKGAK